MRVEFTVKPDTNGRITVVNLIKYIMQYVPEIHVPSDDIMNLPLSSLSLTDDNSKLCVDGYLSGRNWIDGKYTDYDVFLIFG